MQNHKRQNFLTLFFQNTNGYPALAAIASGLYPMLFYVSNNYTLVNSWQHLLYFTSIFLVIPVILFLIADKLSHLSFLGRIQKSVLPFLNAFSFLFFMMVVLFAGLQPIVIAGVFVISLIYGLYFYRSYKKIIVLQFLLAIMGFVFFVPNIIRQATYSRHWLMQPDGIAETIFSKKPNVYFIQPDGYVSFTELKKGYYQMGSPPLEDFLKQEQFTLYPDFRSNYASTTTSNSSLFTMRHHYYNRGLNFTETLNARNIIISKNTVLDVFKNNGYHTVYLAEMPYLLVNKPKMGYDQSNYWAKDVDYITKGASETQDVVPILGAYLSKSKTPTFYFVELFSPGHISVRKKKSKGVEKERELWFERLEETDHKLMTIVHSIKKKDPNALIVILADHGGFVGMEFMHRAYEKTQDRDLVHSIFSSNLAILWPDEKVPTASHSLKTSVNLFRVLFSYLSEDVTLLEHLEKDVSYIPIHKGAPKGIYSYINENNEVVFERFKKVNGK